MRIVSVGHAVFATVMIALGIIGLVTTGFIPLWEPIPKWAPAHVALDYLCAIISLAGGIGLLWLALALWRTITLGSPQFAVLLFFGLLNLAVVGRVIFPGGRAA